MFSEPQFNVFSGSVSIAFSLYTCVSLPLQLFRFNLSSLSIFHPLLHCSFFLEVKRKTSVKTLMKTDERNKIKIGNKIMIRKNPKILGGKIYIFFILVNSCNILRVFPLVSIHSYRCNIFSFSKQRFLSNYPIKVV